MAMDRGYSVREPRLRHGRNQRGAKSNLAIDLQVHVAVQMPYQSAKHTRNGESSWTSIPHLLAQVSVSSSKS
jgi:hypothetical protein